MVTAQQLIKPSKPYGLEAFEYNVSRVLLAITTYAELELVMADRDNAGNVDFLIKHPDQTYTAVVIKYYSSNNISSTLLGRALERIINVKDPDFSNVKGILMINNISEDASAKHWFKYCQYHSQLVNHQDRARFIGVESIKAVKEYYKAEIQVERSILNAVSQSLIPLRPSFDTRIVTLDDIVNKL